MVFRFKSLTASVFFSLNNEELTGSWLLTRFVRDSLSSYGKVDKAVPAAVICVSLVTGTTGCKRS